MVQRENVQRITINDIKRKEAVINGTATADDILVKESTLEQLGNEMFYALPKALQELHAEVVDLRKKVEELENVSAVSQI